MAQTSPPSSADTKSLATKARQTLAKKAMPLLQALAEALEARLNELFEQATSARDSQDKRDAVLMYQKVKNDWVQNTLKAWAAAIHSNPSTTSARLPSLKLELLGEEVVESKILSSRLAMRISDKAGSEWSDLQVRIKFLLNVDELDKSDFLRPEAICQHMIEQWLDCGLTQESWASSQEVFLSQFGDKMPAAYKSVNEFLVGLGVMREIDLRANVKRVPSSAVPTQNAVNMAPAASASNEMQANAASSGMLSRKGGQVSTQIADHVAKLRAQAADFAAGKSPAAAPNAPASNAARPGRAAVAQFAEDEAYETRMQTSATPLARARMRAQGVMGHLKRFITDHVVGYQESGAPAAPVSPGLAAVFSSPPQSNATAVGGVRSPGFQRTQQSPAGAIAAEAQAAPHYPGVQVQIIEGMQAQQVHAALRDQTKEVKKVASTDSEKATIEIVALMFQSILAEERIPSGVRVWFARLQMPVIRLALAESEFFNTLQHPARKLIDRMGSCVLGFDAGVSNASLETEIKRIVQTIEQYPETGRRVFQLVYDEFEKFLSKFLTGSKAAQKVVSLAQQVEQKETAAIQYTIELRRMLGQLPLRDEVRDFLFKVWAEVLAMAAMKHGSQHETTLNLKQVAADLLWAASAKPTRADRAKVISDLPRLLKRLREGMDLLGLEPQIQEAQIKLISDTLADAFMSKTATLEQSQVTEVANRIRDLEKYVSEEDVGDLPIDAESIEMALGIDMSGVQIISKGGSEPNEAMRAWASELEEGAWFNLDHNSMPVRVQYAWKSKLGQLHLFADPQGETYLFQLRRLASYLQAGLLTPIEDETLTVRATREALTKLDANPERLLAIA